MPDETDTLEAEFEQTWDHDRLGTLEAATRAMEARQAPTPRSTALLGGILRRRLDWEAASLLLLDRAATFPGEASILYDAALTGIDAGSYRRAQHTMQRLDLGRLTDRQLRGLWRAAPLVGLHDIALSAFRRAGDHGIPHCTPGIEARLLTAQANAANTALHAGLVSVGENCLPWMLGQRWGLRSAEGMFAQESPFNLAQTVTDGVSGLLERGLGTLLAPDLLSLSTPESGGTLRPLNNFYRFDFNHERGRLFTDDGFAGLAARYAERIANLERYFAGAPCVFFHYAENEGDLNRLVRALRAACAHPHWRLLIVDVWPGERASPVGEQVEYRRVNLPSPGYVWHQPDHWDSDAGLAWERALASLLHRAMANAAAGRND